MNGYKIHPIEFVLLAMIIGLLALASDTAMEAHHRHSETTTVKG
jgi:hypothetical protein